MPPSDSSTWPRFEMKTPEVIQRLRRAAQLAGEALDVALNAAKPGITTTEIDDLVIDFLVSEGAYPSGINYMGFPRAVCMSVNECVVHGIPDTRPLQAGDIVNMDVTCYLDGVYGDTSDMAIVGGETDTQGMKLVNASHRALEAAIGACRPGQPFNAIAKAVVQVAREEGFTVNPQFCGHFIGTEMHLLPNILHTPEHGDMDEPMQIGQVFTIEPVLCEGVGWSRQWNDGWTYVTVDNGRAAQCEHMVNITPTGAEILTKRPGAVGCDEEREV
ncbi:hypothetical protein FOZ61_004615 [Perkinsus olseni]|uniref:Methionine aminopeptidase n=1 Tax=Perkinsus olseni TaxID=32597 RepID=A0A7J6LX76_PEROL|nr:hypothetical protein FOZ61_004615 [Perkinsus olseni]KAF4663867.1 hypothetical protein FOL46_004514 [Perkinsus olseni]